MDAISPKSQRRNLAILFADLCDSTRISGSLEPEQFAALLEQLRGLYDAVIGRHGGLIVRIDGDGVTCAFGYPSALDDVGRRATEAALDLHAAVAALDQTYAVPDVGIRLHSGVHSGVVLVREGDMVRGRIEILGDTTNVAARLCDHAGPDQIVVSEASLGGDRHFFLGEDQVAVPLKGRKAAVPALLVTGRAEVATRFAARSKRGMAPFCGRAAELARLRALLEDCRRGPARQATLVGQPGIGKTRMLSEFLDEAAAAGVEVHRGYCEAYLGARPLQPFEQIAQSLGQGGGDVPARMLRWAGSSKDQPAILAIDDWQWADDASHVLLGEVVRARTEKLLIVLASRPDGALGPDGEGGDRIELGPLSEAESAKAIAGLLRSADPFRLERIRELSGGSPLYIEELCHAQAALPGAESEGGTAWLDALVNARFAELAPNQAELVRTAAVIGHMVPLGLFAAVTGIGAGDPVLVELSDSDFLYQGDVAGTLRFKHALTRDAIYRTVGFDERKRLHTLVAERLEALAAQEGEADYVDALAYHNWAAGSDDRALVYSIAAGDAALAAGALDRAQRHYRVAFDLVESLPDDDAKGGYLWSVLNKFGLASIVDPAADQLELVERARSIAQQLGDRRAIVRSAYWLGAIAYGNGEGKRSVGYLTEAQRELGSHDSGSYFANLIGVKLAQSLFVAGRYPEAKRLYRETIDFVRVIKGRNDLEISAYALASYGFLLADQGDFPAAQALYREAENVLGDESKPMNASFLGFQSVTSLWIGRWEDGIDHSTRAIRSSEISRARYQRMINEAKIAYAQWKLSQDGSSRRTLETVAQWFMAPGNSRQRASLVFGWLIDLLAAQGAREPARRYAIAMIDRVRRGGDRLGEAMAWRGLARLENEAGHQRIADRYLARAARSAEIRDSRRERALNRLCLAQLQQARGELQAARDSAGAAEAEFAAMGADYFAALARAIANR